MSMDTDNLYERWRQSRSQIDPSERFVDRVMESIDSPTATNDLPSTTWRISGSVRASVCAAAALAAVFRVVELLNLFAANRIEN
jgi:hypothetical protein